MGFEFKYFWMNLREPAIKLAWVGVFILTGGLAVLPFFLGGIIGAVGVIFLTVPFGLICAHIFARKIVAPVIARKIANDIFFPEGGTPPPPEFPQIRAKVANEKYAEAVADLKALLEKDPGNCHVIALLIEIFVTKTEDHENAIGLISAYLKKNGRCAQDVPIVMKLVDVYLEEEARDRAIALLEDELKRKYPEKELKYLRARLEGIEGSRQ